MATFKPVRFVKTKYGTYSLHYTSPDGRRRRLSVGSDEKHAQRLSVRVTDWLLEGKDPEREMEHAKQTEQYKAVTLNMFFPVFMKRHGSLLRPETQRSYHRCFKNICQAMVTIGHKKSRLVDLLICDIRKAFVQDYLQARMELHGVKPSTVNREFELLRCMLNRAVEWDIIERNQLQGLRPLKEGNRRDVSNISPKMVGRLLETLPSSVANIVEFAIYTGWRKENILDLRIEQVLINEIGDIGEAWLVSKGNKQETKPIGRQAVEVFKRAIGKRTSGHVFLNPNTCRRYSCISKTLDRAIYKLDLRIVDGRKLCFHDFRRLCATWLLNEGRSLDEVREVLGHADRKTTDRYARLRVKGDVFDVMPRVRVVAS